jgi:hypothetical protein
MIRDPKLSPGRSLKNYIYNLFFNFWSNTILVAGFSSADFLEGFFTVSFIELFEAIKAVSGIAEYFAC